MLRNKTQLTDGIAFRLSLALTLAVGTLAVAPLRVKAAASRVVIVEITENYATSAFNQIWMTKTTNTNRG